MLQHCYRLCSGRGESRLLSSWRLRPGGRSLARLDRRGIASGIGGATFLCTSFATVLGATAFETACLRGPVFAAAVFLGATALETGCDFRRRLLWSDGNFHRRLLWSYCSRDGLSQNGSGFRCRLLGRGLWQSLPWNCLRQDCSLGGLSYAFWRLRSRARR